MKKRQYDHILKGSVMEKVFLICGKICCGKSTYAEQLRSKYNAVILSVDEIMLSIFGDHTGEKHDEYCKNVQKYLFEKSLEFIYIGVSVILDWGFWQKTDREFAKDFYRSKKIVCELHFIDISEKTWKQRIAMRNDMLSRGKLNAYCVDENLARKFDSIFEYPDKDEIDVFVKER